MKLNVTKTIGKRKYPFQFEGETLFDVLMESQKLSFGDLDKCGLCGSDDLKLEAYIGGKHKYIKVQCGNRKCWASLTFGKREDDPTVCFYRKNADKELDWKKYEKKEVE